MPAITIFDSKEEVPESLRESAQEVDGKFHVDASALTSKLQEILGEKKTRDAEVRRLKAEFEKYKDLDPEKAREALQNIQDAEAEKLKAKGDWDSREKALKSGFDTEKTAWTAEKSTYETALDDLVIFNELARVGALPEVKLRDAELIQPHISRFVKRKGLKDYEVLDASGQVRYGPDGNPLKLDSFLRELREHPKMSIFFEATGASGSGAPSSTGGAGKSKTMKRAEFDKLDPISAMEAVKAKVAIVD